MQIIGTNAIQNSSLASDCSIYIYIFLTDFALESVHSWWAAFLIFHKSKQLKSQGIIAKHQLILVSRTITKIHNYLSAGMRRGRH